MKRIRKGKEVDIPEEWVGVFTTKETKRQRKIISKLKRLNKKKILKSFEKFDLDNQLWDEQC